MARLFNFQGSAVVETTNLSAVRAGEMISQYKMAAALANTGVQNGQLLVFNHATKEVTFPSSGTDYVVLAASEERQYQSSQGLNTFKTTGKNLPRLSFLKRGDKFETNAVDAGSFTSVAEAKDPQFGAKFGIPKTNGDIELYPQLPGDATYKTVLGVVDFVTLPNNEPGIRFVVLQSGIVGLAVAKSEEADFLTFSMAEQTKPATINATAKTVAVEVLYDTDVTDLVATFRTSNFVDSILVGATPQVSGTTSNDFTSPVTYDITAEDETTTENWVVTVTEADPSDEADILSFSFAEQTGDAVIDAVNRTIAIEVASDADITDLIATFTTSDFVDSIVVGLTPQVSGTTSNDFTSPVDYELTAQDGTTTITWTVTVTVEV
ncbi:MAG: hypothetical protein EOM05_09445 [Clostridia bacterium]|nr:hypothetical protein [Clostridia bacterium]